MLEGSATIDPFYQYGKDYFDVVDSTLINVQKGLGVDSISMLEASLSTKYFNERKPSIAMEDFTVDLTVNGTDRTCHKKKGREIKEY